MPTKTCPLCRSPFNCLNNEHCWCWDPRAVKLLNRIPEGVTECICDRCLLRLPEKVPTAKKKQDYVAGSSVAGVGGD